MDILCGEPKLLPIIAENIERTSDWKNVMLASKLFHPSGKKLMERRINHYTSMELYKRLYYMRKISVLTEEDMELPEFVQNNKIRGLFKKYNFLRVFVTGNEIWIITSVRPLNLGLNSETITIDTNELEKMDIDNISVIFGKNFRCLPL